MSDVRKVICDYCGEPAELVLGVEYYPRRPDLAHLLIWECKPCKASVGTHKGSKDAQPLGRLANAALKKKKMAAHAAFDPLWRGGLMKRTEAYEWLAGELGILVKNCHIGMFDEKMCTRVVEVCRERMRHDDTFDDEIPGQMWTDQYW